MQGAFVRSTVCKAGYQAGSARVHRLTRMSSSVQNQPSGAGADKHADDEYRAYASYFHTLRNAHNRVVLGVDVLINKPMDDAERMQRITKLQDAARQVTELLDQAPIPRAR